MVIATLIGTATSLFVCLRLIHIYQLEGYRLDGCVRWLKRTEGVMAIDMLFYGASSFIVMLCVATLLREYDARFLAVFVYPILVVLFRVIESKAVVRVPLRFTPRMIRFFVCHAVVCTAGCYGLVRLGYNTDLMFTLVGLMPVFLFVTIPVAHCIIYPVERIIYNSFKRKAVKKLAQYPRLITVGITGSYGKTSVKNYLAEMLKCKYRVCASPASYNTAMGICKTINSITSEEVLVAEMGARRVGDIAELVRMLPLDIAVITAVEKQHLETFKTLQKVAKTKGEILDGIKQGGVGVFNGTSKAVLPLFDSFNGRKILVASNASLSGKMAYFDKVKVTSTGSTFDLVIKGRRISCATSLLGEHNVENITVAASVAFELGVSMEEIRDCILHLKPVPHRLELVPNTAGLTIIDDAYNSNPQGARMAIKVLSLFPHKRVVVTSGLVELGADSVIENETLGEELSEVADWCVLVGRNAEVIKRGLIKGGFEKRVNIVANLPEAQQMLDGNLKQGDSVLFLNDVPDNY